MGRKTTDLSHQNHNTATSFREALLFTTMSIIGFPVDVQVKDGSVYSGIFHTACFDKDYGIVLKKAKMVKKGKKEANLANGAVVETLVVLSGDLVQVVAKGHLLSADGVVGSIPNEDVEAVNGSIESSEYLDTQTLRLNSSKDVKEVLVADTNHISQTRRLYQNVNKLDNDESNNVGVGLVSNVKKGQSTEVRTKHLGSAVESENRKDVIHMSKIKETSVGPVGLVDEGQVVKGKTHKKKALDQKVEPHKDDTIHEIHYSSSGTNANIPQLKSVNGVHVDISLRISSNGPAFGSTVPSLVKQDTQVFERTTSVDSSSLELSASELSSSLTTTVNLTSQSCTVPSASQTASIALKDSVPNTSGKEFKLNPEAKTFLPTFSIPNSLAPPAATTVASMAFIPNNNSVVPVAVAPQEIGISSFAPRSVKFVPYNNLVAVNGDSTSQYSQPVVGHMGSRQQPIRYANQYNHLQAGATYVHPNSQPVMLGVGRLGQLVYMDPNSQDLLQGSAIPSQLTARPQLTTQVHLPKHQGSAAAQSLQVFVTQPPFVATVQQPFAMASQVPFSQPTFPVVRPVPGANGHFGSKYF